MKSYLNNDICTCCRYTKMKTATNIYIFNLALADALVLATLPFQGTDVILGFWPFGLALCKAVVAIDYYNMFTSVFTLTIMSVDRYIAVCHPVRSLTVRTPLRAKLINVAVWVLASAVGLPVMIMGQVEEEKDGYGSLFSHYPVSTCHSKACLFILSQKCESIFVIFMLLCHLLPRMIKLP